MLTLRFSSAVGVRINCCSLFNVFELVSIHFEINWRRVELKLFQLEVFIVAAASIAMQITGPGNKQTDGPVIRTQVQGTLAFGTISP